MTGIGTLTRTELRLYLRDPAAAFFALALPVVLAVVLIQVFGGEQENAEVFDGHDAADYYLPGFLGLSLSAVGYFALPVRIASYDEEGVLRRFAASGMGRSTFVLAEAAVAFASGIVGAALLVLAIALGYDLSPVDDVVGVVVGFVLAAAMYLGLGLLLGSVLGTARAAQGLGLVLFFLGMLLSGTGPPRQLLGEPLGLVADVLPSTYAVDAIKSPWLGDGYDLRALAICAGIAVLGTALGLRFIRWGGERPSLRRSSPSSSSAAHP